MKRLILIMVVLGGCSVARAGSPVSTLESMKAMVRILAQLESASMITDTSLGHLCGLALTQVSTEIGGVEAQYRFVMAKDSMYYILPDTVVRVISGQLHLTDGSVTDLRQFPPQYYNAVFDLSKLGGTSEDDVPLAFVYWADTIQLMPAPQRTDADTIVLRCYVEHPYLTNDSMSLRLPGGCVNAALQLAVHLALRSVRAFEEAATWKADYDQSKTELQQVYARPVETVPGEVKQ